MALVKAPSLGMWLIHWNVEGLDPVASRSAHAGVTVMWKGIPFPPVPPNRERVNYILWMLFRTIFISTKFQNIWTSCSSVGRTWPSTGWQSLCYIFLHQQVKTFPRSPSGSCSCVRNLICSYWVYAKMRTFFCAYRSIRIWFSASCFSSLYSLWGEKKNLPHSQGFSTFLIDILKYVFPVFLS